MNDRNKENDCSRIICWRRWAQPQLKNHNEIIANEAAQINLQAAQNPEKSGSGGLYTVSMTELYDTVYPPRTPVVDGFLYGGTYLL